MELKDTPNPNAKKIELGHDLLNYNMIQTQQDKLSSNLKKIDGVVSVFFGPNFITISKDKNVMWESISEDIMSIFDKL
tara:strand:+ start:587 stop:820 length:234 start_codon:yes stop_codon:yes gene_type:complete